MEARNNTVANNQVNTAPPPQPGNDTDGNEISLVGKIWAGVLLVFLTLFSALYIIGHWPDRLPTPRESIKPLYTYSWFNVKLVDSIIEEGKISSSPAERIIEKTGRYTSGIQDSMSGGATDTNRQGAAGVGRDTVNGRDSLSQQGAAPYGKYMGGPEKDLMHINTLLLILVATAGFLGNMIYVATSFTTFVGAGKFKRSWTLWYFVKPFTASALAVGIYFVFRGGFLNMSDDSTNINMYGVMSISLLAGLFTDRATLKLKEVFDVLLRPKEERPDQLENYEPKVNTVKAEPLEVGKAVPITLAGENLDSGNVTVSIEGQAVPLIKRDKSHIDLSYTLPAELKDKEAVTVVVQLEKKTRRFSLAVKPQGEAGEQGQQAGEDGEAGNDANSINSIRDIIPDAVEEERQPVVKD